MLDARRAQRAPIEAVCRAHRSPRTWSGLFVLGPALGVLVGWIGITALARVASRIGVRRDYESLYALGLAFCAFAAAESVGGSGFVAAFAAGLMIDAQDTELCDCFMEYGEATAEMFLLLTFVALGTHVIWTGLDVIQWRTLLFAAIALGVRTAVLYPMLGGLGLPEQGSAPDRVDGPARIECAAARFAAGLRRRSRAPRPCSRSHAWSCCSRWCCTVAAIAWLVRGKPGASLGAAARAPTPRPPKTASLAGRCRRRRSSAAEPERITLDELRDAVGRRAVVVADARKDAAYYGEGRRAAGAIRLDPDDPVPDAEASRLPQGCDHRRLLRLNRRSDERPCGAPAEGAGWPKARALVGGWKAWNEAEMPTESIRPA